VGRRITLGTANRDLASTTTVLDTLYARALAGDCDLVVLGKAGGLRRGWQFDPLAGNLRPDRAAEARLSKAALRALAADGSELTWFGVPSGSGLRMALDRDRDTFFDRDELDAGSDPGNPLSTPGQVAVGPGGVDRLAFGASPNPFRGGGTTTLAFTLPRAADVRVEIFDAAGRRVARVLDRRMPAGSGAVTWNGEDDDGQPVRAGVYFYRLSALGQRLTAKGIRL
jgi:hypothetical protein